MSTSVLSILIEYGGGITVDSHRRISAPDATVISLPVGEAQRLTASVHSPKGNAELLPLFV